MPIVPAYLRQLSYMNERRSWAEVSRETGITSRSLQVLARGKREPTEEQSNNLKNAYRRIAYSTLRDEGFSTQEARRHSSARPETAQLMATQLYYKVAELAQGIVAMKLKSYGLETTVENVNRFYDDAVKQVKTGIRKTKRSTEQILDY